MVQVTQYLPVTSAYVIPFMTANFLVKHGAMTVQSFFLRRELAESAATLRALAGPQVVEDLSVVDLIGGFYYYLADQRQWRGQVCGVWSV